MSFLEAIRAAFPDEPTPSNVTPIRKDPFTNDPLQAPRGGYLDAAVAAELDALRSTAEGSRNARLNEAAFSLGQLIEAGLDQASTVQALEDAAREIGLSVSEIGPTIRSGLAAGAQKPRQIPERQETPTSWLPSPASPAVPPAPWENTPTTPSSSTTGPSPSSGTASDADGDASNETADLTALVHQHLPRVDWHALWADETEEEWIVEPILPARRLVAIYSPPKVGKSLLMLEIAAAVASGRPTLGITPDRARTVLYVDFENDPKGDIRQRLRAMGYRPGMLDNLVYLSFPTMGYLDGPKGGRELLAAVQVYGAEVVVIDTVSRAVEGEENDNDTWLGFYRNTGLLLKQAQVALIRLDHTGKDETKGQRGGSAKGGDVDAVWRLSTVTRDETYKLECEMNRMQVSEKVLVLHRKTGPLRHEVDAAGRSGLGAALRKSQIDALAAAGFPVDGTRREGQRIVKDACGRGVGDKYWPELIAAYARHLNLGAEGSAPDPLSEAGAKW